MFNKYKKYIPNAITLSRIGMALGFIGAFISGNMALSLALFASAGISDAIDGNLARRWKVQSKFGKKADTIADKLLVVSGLVLLGLNYNPLMLIPCIMEGIIMTISAYSHKKGKELDVNKYGKLKAITIMTTLPLSMLSLTKTFSFLNNSLAFSTLIDSLLIGTTILQSITAKKYISQYRNYNAEEIKKYRESISYIDNDFTTTKKQSINNENEEILKDTQVFKSDEISNKIEALKKIRENLTLHDEKTIEHNKGRSKTKNKNKG